MAELTRDEVRYYHLSDVEEYPVAAGVTIYEGAAVGENGSGYARPLVAGDQFLGFASKRAANVAGVAGAERVQVKTNGLVKLLVAGVTVAANKGAHVYASNDGTFTVSAYGNSRIGKVHKVESDGYALVRIDVASKSSETPSLTWPTKPTAADFGKGQAWFSDIGATGYCDGVTWAVTGEGDLYKTNGIAFNEFLTGTSSLTSSTTGAGATLATSTAYGGRGVTITQNTGENIQSTLTFNCAAPFRLEADTVICWLLHMVDPGGISSFRTEVTTQAKNFAGYLSVASPDTAGAAPVNQGGGQAVMYVLGSLLDTGVTGDGSVRIGSYIDRIRLVVKLTAGTKLTVLGCYANPMNITAIPITFDDGYESSYLEGFTYMQKKGLRGTMAINTHTIETTGRMKLRQMQDVYKAGWDVVNHSHSHRHVSFGYGVTLSTVGPCNQIATAQTASAGVPLTLDGTIADAVFDAPRCIVFRYASSPSASYIYVTINGIDENGIERTVTFPQFTNTQCATEYVWTKVNSVVLNKDAGVTVAVGVSLSYDEILTEVLPPKTYLANNGFNRGADIYVAPFGEENILLRRVLADLGYKYLRRTRTNVEYPFLCPTCMAMGAAGDGITSGGSATLIAYANKLVAHRGSGGMYLHSIVEDSATPNSSEARVSDFRLVIDDYAAKQAAGTAIFPTYSEYVRMCGYS